MKKIMRRQKVKSKRSIGLAPGTLVYTGKEKQRLSSTERIQ